MGIIRRQPSLNALKAFEAVARHRSVARAAAELHVTAPAISHRIRGLEDDLGMALFSRQGREISLTEAAVPFANKLSEAFGLIGEALQALDPPAGGIHLSAAPSVVNKWLMPRIDEFSQENPAIDIVLTATSSISDLSSEAIDLALRRGNGSFARAEADHLFEAVVAPVCAPALLATTRAGERGRWLRDQVLLHDLSSELPGRRPGWGAWPGVVRSSDPKWQRGPRFNRACLAIDAAIAGRGVALAVLALCVDDIRAGRLALPFGYCLPAPQAYWLVRPAAKRLTDGAERFRRWLLEEASTTRRDLAALGLAPLPD